jgi:hypothetical protein
MTYTIPLDQVLFAAERLFDLMGWLEGCQKLFTQFAHRNHML